MVVFRPALYIFSWVALCTVETKEEIKIEKKVEEREERRGEEE